MLRRKVDPGQAGLKGNYYNFFPLYYSFLFYFKIFNDKKFIIAALFLYTVPLYNFKIIFTLFVTVSALNYCW